MKTFTATFLGLVLMVAGANALDWANAPLACLPDRAEKWSTINEMEPCHCPPKDYCPPFIKAIDPKNVVFYVTARNKVAPVVEGGGADSGDSGDSSGGDSGSGSSGGDSGGIPGGGPGSDGGASSSGASHTPPDLSKEPYVYKFVSFTADELSGFVGNSAVTGSVGGYSGAKFKQFIEPKIEELTGWDLDDEYFSYQYNYKISEFDPSAKIIDMAEEDLPLPRFYAQKCCVSDKAPKCPAGYTTGWTDGNNYGYTRYSYLLTKYNKNYKAYGFNYWVDSTNDPDRIWTSEEVEGISGDKKVTGLNSYYCSSHVSTTVTGREGCIIEGTPVLLSNGNDVKIEELKVGDMLKSNKGDVKIIAINKFTQEKDTIYGINGETAFISEEHPVLTTSGWKAVNPEITSVKSGMGAVGKLNVGDKIVTVDGEIEILTIDRVELELGATVYNLSIEGGEGFYANGMMVKDFNQVQIHY